MTGVQTCTLPILTIAILGTIFLTQRKNETTGSYEDLTVSGLVYGLIFLALGLGTIIGWLTAKKVQMTKMPELVSMFNGMGGACAALIGLMEFEHYAGDSGALIAIVSGMVIGSVSFSGSIIAYLKLNGTMNKPIRLPSYNIKNTVVMIGVIGFSSWLIYSCSAAGSALWSAGEMSATAQSLLYAL